MIEQNYILPGKRQIIHGVYLGMGNATGYMGRSHATVLLARLTLIDPQNSVQGFFLAWQQWFQAAKSFKNLQLKAGDLVEFTGRIGIIDCNFAQQHSYFYITYPAHVRKIGRYTQARRGMEDHKVQQTLFPFFIKAMGGRHVAD